jgi:uncharacterized protein YraI
MRFLALLFLLALPAAAQPVWNLGATPVPLHGGPSAAEPVIGGLAPGASAELGRCDAQGRWCLLSTDGIFGWVDTDATPLPARGTTVQPVTQAPTVTVTPLPDPGAPLPQSVLDAVPAPGPEVMRTAPKARIPAILSREVPVLNVTDGLVNLRAGPGTEHPIVGGLEPGQGGLIELCDAWERWCLIGAPSGPGWVKMTLVGERRLDVGPR